MTDDNTGAEADAAEVQAASGEGAELATAIVFSATAEVIPGGAK